MSHLVPLLSGWLLINGVTWILGIIFGDIALPDQT